MSHRWVRGLVEASEGLGPGWGAGRPRGAKRLGCLYERRLGEALPSFRRGVWWRFVDSAGPGWCQTDLVLVGRQSVLVLEAKLSWVEEGHTQLEELYKPVVGMALGMEVLGVLVTGRLRPGMPRGVQVVGDLSGAVESARAGKRTVLHWLGASAMPQAKAA